MGGVVGFPSGPVGEESACSSGDLRWIPGSGEAGGRRLGSPVQAPPGEQMGEMDCCELSWAKGKGAKDRRHLKTWDRMNSETPGSEFRSQPYHLLPL